ncbi:MAG: hypothetical protein KGL34_10670 [Gammaproteobacteria bacterium]|nr:hypothetical protein [Gammaproteobacteria bacterium]
MHSRTAAWLSTLATFALGAATMIAVADDATPRAPLPNSDFYPGRDAQVAGPFHGVLDITQTKLATRPRLLDPMQQGRDARLFPGVRLEFFTLGDQLVPVARGEIVAESAPGAVRSYWSVIPQFGRIWREPGDGAWSRGAFPLMLVNDTENAAHQGLALFRYRAGRVSHLRLQFVQESAPYVLKQHFVAWGSAPMHLAAAQLRDLRAARAGAAAELAARLPAQPLSALLARLPAGTLDGFGGPVLPQWRVETALVDHGILYYQPSATPYGPYPYPLEMRFGVRSIMKSVGPPLALLRLAKLYGPWVLDLKIGDYVAGLDPKWRTVRFRDAADMASGFGGVGSLRTRPNDLFDGYLQGDYDAWYLAPSYAEKIAQIDAHLRPYPWAPGTVVRYRDQDMFLLGAALDHFLKSMRGPNADIWDMLRAEVFAPIGIFHAPAVRTIEAHGRRGLVWFNAGYYPTLDDLAKIARLYSDLGAHDGRQILDRPLTAALMAARGALPKTGDLSGGALGRAAAAGEPPSAQGLYEMGFHFQPFVPTPGRPAVELPTMFGSGENEVVIYPNGMISLVMAKAAELPPGAKAKSDRGPETLRAVYRLAPF